MATPATFVTTRLVGKDGCGSLYATVRQARFRRQQPIGPYIAGFCCLPLKLIIELDGSQHHLAGRVVQDGARTRWLEARGFAVLRFQNTEALKERERLLGVILHAIESRSPSPKNALHFSTLPQGEGGLS